MSNWRVLTTSLAAGIGILSCAGLALHGSGPEWSPLPVEKMTPGQAGQMDRANEARAALFNRLNGRLQEELSQGSAASAIGVCRDEAPRIAREVGRDNDLAIGRTSYRIRNPANRPPSWAEPWIRNRTENPVYLQGRDGRFAALLPIRTLKTCETCHGPDGQIPPDVRAALLRNYPEDRATGFREGDLRGWFWVEVPGSAVR